MWAVHTTFPEKYSMKKSEWGKFMAKKTEKQYINHMIKVNINDNNSY